MLPFIYEWVPKAGAAGIVVLVTIIFLRNFKWIIEKFESMMNSQRELFAKQLDEHQRTSTESLKETRSTFYTVLKEQREDFGNQLGAVTATFNSHHQATTEKIGELVESQQKVASETVNAINGLRTEVASLADKVKKD